MNKDKPIEFIVKRKSPYNDDKSVSMSLRISRELQSAYDELAMQSNRSRNEVMCMALEFAIEHLRIIDEKEATN